MARIASWDNRKFALLTATAALTALVFVADWAVPPSLGVLYVLPVMVGAIVFSRFQIVAFAVLCSGLFSLFDVPESQVEHLLRICFSGVTYIVSGLFVSNIVRNRKLAVANFTALSNEKERSQRLEEQMKLLVQNSPAAILTADSDGVVLECNEAANSLIMGPSGGSIVGMSISRFVPVLGDALRFKGNPDNVRTAAQCLGRRINGEIFRAHSWFSCYSTAHGTRLAAIVVDSSEEMRDREEEGWRELIRGNRLAAATVSHEMRNLCSAILMAGSNLQSLPGIEHSEELKRLISMVEGLRRIAAGELFASGPDQLQAVNLQDVLDDLHIVIEPEWREIDGCIQWDIPPEMPPVLGERQGLLHAFLNLAKNSHRAVQQGSVRQLSVCVSVEPKMVHVKFRDTGPGVAHPERLFRAHQEHSDGSGMGLYISRSLLRSYGGDLNYEPLADGASFRVDLHVA